MRGYPYWAACILRRGFFSHRTHRSNETFLAHVSSPQKAFGIQRSQSVSAIVDTDKRQQAAYILPIGVSRCLRSFPSGEGTGEGPSSSLNLVRSVHLCKSVREKKPACSGNLRKSVREKKSCVFCSSVLLCERKKSPQ